MLDLHPKIDLDTHDIKNVIYQILLDSNTSNPYYSPGLEFESERQKGMVLLGQLVIGFFWTYFLYHSWNHSEHHLVVAGFSNPLGELTDAVTGHYVGWKGNGAISARIETIDKVLYQ